MFTLRSFYQMLSKMSTNFASHKFQNIHITRACKAHANWPPDRLLK
jgi:hypothetical protein